MAKLKTGRHTSAIKAQRQAERREQMNRGLKKKIKLTVKDLKNSLASKDGKEKDKLSKAISSLDKAAKKNILHWKTASRKKSRLAKSLNKKD